jgi:hypothetical protein
VHVLTRDIEDLCDANGPALSPEAAPAAGDKVAHALKMFYSAFKQPFSLDFYVRRLVQYTNCSASAFVVAMVYLDRLQQATPGLRLGHMNCHRLLITAVVLAAKYLDDEVYSNAYYARVGGLTTQELNRLEAAMLDLLSWNLSVSPATYALFEDSLLNAACASDSDSYADDLAADADDLVIADDDIIDKPTAALSASSPAVSVDEASAAARSAWAQAPLAAARALGDCNY